MSVLVTAISRHICYLLNIGGKFCFSLRADLTVIFANFWSYLAFIFVGKFRILLRGLAHAHVMGLPPLNGVTSTF